MPACMYVEENGSAAMLAAKWVAGVAPEVNLRDHVKCMLLPSLNKALPTLALKPRGDITRSPKQGYQWPHKKNLYPPKILKKEQTWCGDKFWFECIVKKERRIEGVLTVADLNWKICEACIRLDPIFFVFIQFSWKYFEQDCIPVGCVPPARWPYLTACSPGGCLLRGGVCSGGCLLWGVFSGGVSAPGGVCSGGVCSGGCLLRGSAPGGVRYPLSPC